MAGVGPEVGVMVREPEDLPVCHEHVLRALRRADLRALAVGPRRDAASADV